MAEPRKDYEIVLTLVEPISELTSVIEVFNRPALVSNLTMVEFGLSQNQEISVYQYGEILAFELCQNRSAANALL